MVTQCPHPQKVQVLTGYTLRQALGAPKDKLSCDEKHGVVYSVRCHGYDGEWRDREKIKFQDERTQNVGYKGQ